MNSVGLHVFSQQIREHHHHHQPPRDSSCRVRGRLFLHRRAAQTPSKPGHKSMVLSTCCHRDPRARSMSCELRADCCKPKLKTKKPTCLQRGPRQCISPMIAETQGGNCPVATRESISRHSQHSESKTFKAQTLKAPLLEASSNLHRCWLHRSQKMTAESR